MELKKITEVVVTDSNGKELVEGRNVVYSDTDGKTFCGKYRGLNQRNNLVFESIIDENFIWSVMPKCIDKIYSALIEV